MSLVLEKILFDFVYNRVRDELSNAQHGFRCRRSTFTQLLDYIDKVFSSCDGNIDYYSVNFDDQKAFDTVSHNKLLFKLRAFGFADAFIELLSSYLSGRTQRNRINVSLSSCTAVPSGVPQGSILGPLLFLIFLNDLPDCVNSSSFYLFADDLKLFSKSSPKLFQNDINSVANWVKDNGLIFHTSKTVLLTNVTNSQFFLIDTAITISNSVKDLGFNLCPDLNWNNHINIKLGKSMHSFYYIKRIVSFSIPVKTKLSVYVACVQSILLYNSCVWKPNVTLLKKIEKLHKKAKKWVSGRDNYVAAFLILRILSICYQIILNDLVLFSKVLQKKYDFNIFINVSFYYSRAGNRCSDTTVFELPKVREITTWGSYFYRTVENANYFSGKGINLLQNPSTVKKHLETLLFNKLTEFNLNSSCSFVLNCKCATCRVYCCFYFYFFIPRYQGIKSFSSSSSSSSPVFRRDLVVW